MAKRKMSTFERLQRGELSRKRRKQLEQQIAKQDASLPIVPLDPSGIEVGNDSHFVSVGPSETGSGCESSDPGPGIYGAWWSGSK